MALAEVIGGGAQVLGGIAQYYQSEKARKASADKLDEIEEAFNAIKPPDYDLSVMDPPDYITKSVPEPAFDFSKFTPQQLKVVGKFSPTAASYIAEKNPEVITKSAEGRKGRQAQMDALNKFRQLAETGQDPIMQQMQDQAGRSAQIQAQSRQQSILQDAARRGQMGSGAALAAQLQGSSDAMERAAMQSQQAASDAYRNKLEAMRQSAQLGGDIAQQDVAEQARNVDIINAFNQRTASGRQQYENALAEMANKGQLYNLGEAQRVSDANIGAANQAAMADRARQDALLREQYGMRTGEQARQNQIIEAQQKWRASERDVLNQMKGQQFQNKMQRQGQLANVGSQQIANIQGAAADRNKAIQGVTSAIGSGAMAYSNYKPAAEENLENSGGAKRAEQRQAGW